MRFRLLLVVSLVAACTGDDGVRHLDAHIADVPVDVVPVDAANVTVKATAGTGGTVTVTSVTGGPCTDASCTLATGASTVTFTPTANTDFRFDTWTGASCTDFTADGDSITYTNPIVDHACNATFVATVNVTAIAGAGGSIVATAVTNGSCAGTACTLDAGAGTVTFTPMASANHAFTGWSGCSGYTQSGDSITFTNPTSAKTCSAGFGATIMVTATAGTGGTVSATNVSGGSCSGTNCTLQSGGSSVTFTPTASTGYRFGSWTGCTGYSQSGNAITFTNPTTAKSCTASFVATVSVSATAGTGGSVAATGVTGGSCSGTNCTLDSGASTVTFTPMASTNYRFGGWTGCTGYTQNGDAITFTNPTTAKSCTASFVPTVSVSATAGTGGTVAASAITGGNCSGTNCTLDSGASTVTFTPTASTNYRFGSWSGCTGYTQSGNAITFTNPTTAKSCTANFVATVNVAATAGTGGSVAASAITGGSCSGTNCTLDSGASTVTFTPSATTGYRFGSWSGCTGYTQSGNAITFTNPTTAKSCTANFVATVNVSATAGTGGSVAASAITGGSCSGTNCTLDSGASTVTFTPSATTGYRFGSWSGCTGYTQSGNSITFTNPTTAKSCTASFVAQVTVSATAGTGGSVSVTSVTGGSCSNNSCTVDSGANSVTFAASANSGYRFSGWSSCSTSTNATVTVTNATTTTTCVASFTPTVTIQATPAPAAGGSISVTNLSNGTCSGSTCQLDSGNSSVTFTPVAASGYRFGSWSNCTPDPNSASVTFTNPTASASCIANFVATVKIVGVPSVAAGGTISVSSQINASCIGSDCTLDSGNSRVTFTPSANSGYRFTGWSGAGCPQVAASASITILNPTSSLTCTANFVKTINIKALAMASNNTPSTQSSVSASNITGGFCSGTDCTLDSGASTVTFTPVPGPNSPFQGWQGCTGYTQGPNNSITFTNATASQTCTAVFLF